MPLWSHPITLLTKATKSLRGHGSLTRRTRLEMGRLEGAHRMTRRKDRGAQRHTLGKMSILLRTLTSILTAITMRSQLKTKPSEIHRWGLQCHTSVKLSFQNCLDSRKNRDSFRNSSIELSLRSLTECQRRRSPNTHLQKPSTTVKGHLEELL